MSRLLDVLRKQVADFKSGETVHLEPTSAMQISIDDFMGLMKTVKSIDRSILLPLLYNISPFLSTNFDKLKKIDDKLLWKCMIDAADLIETDLEMFGFLEAVSSICLHSIKISEEFLDYLKTSTSRIVAYVLVALYEEIPKHFVKEHRDHFLPLITQSFMTNDPIHQIYLILLVEKLKLDSEPPELMENMWSAVLSVIKNHTCHYASLMGPLLKLKQKSPALFCCGFLGRKLQSEDMITLIRIIPFVRQRTVREILEIVVPVLAGLIAQTNDIDNRITLAFKDAFLASEDDTVEAIYAYCNEALATQNYPAAIYISGVYAPAFMQYNQEHADRILEMFVAGLESEYPLKVPLCFAISYNQKTLSEDHDDLVTERIIPALVKCIETGEKNLVDWSIRALSGLITCECFPLFPPISRFVELFDNIPAESAQPLFAFLAQCASDEEAQTEDLEAVLGLVKRVLGDDSLPMYLRSAALKPANALCKEEAEYLKDLCESGVKVSKETLNSNEYSYYSDAIRFLALCSESRKDIDLTDIREKIISIPTSEEIPKNVRIKCGYSLSLLRKIDFPERILHLFLADEESMETGTSIIMNLFDTMNKDHLRALFSIVVQGVKESTNIKFVNEGFLLADKMMSIKNPPVSELENLLATTMQGRLALLNRTMPYNYDNSSFKFYTFAATFCTSFPKKSRWVVNAMISWIPRLSSYMVTRVLEVVRVGISLIDADTAKQLANYAMARIDEDITDYDLVACAVPMIMELRVKHPNIVGVDELLVMLEHIWEDNDEELSFVLLLSPIFLSIFADKSFDIEGDFHIFNEIASMVSMGAVTLDYPKMISYFVQMHDNSVPFKSFNEEAGNIFANFLIKDTNILQKDGFSTSLLQDMHRCLKQIFKNHKSALRRVQRMHKDDDNALKRLEELLKSPKLPKFPKK